MESINRISGNASEQAYQTLKRMIAEYQLVPGQKITYIQLAEKMKMSKTPIINALKMLEQEEFVISLPNRGFFIKEVDSEELKELYTIREALEVLAVEEGIKNYDLKMIEKIEQAMIAHREYHYNIVTRNRLALDAIFHLKIAEMSRNRNLVRLIKQNFERVYLRYRSEGISPTRIITSTEQHQKIFDAMKEKDALEAVNLIRQHIRDAETSAINGTRRGEEIVVF